MNIKEVIKKRILVLDGAMGSLIQRQKLTEADFRGNEFKEHPIDLRGNNDLLNLTRPELIKSIHKEYLNAGADIIETNTFSSNAISMSDYKLEEYVYRINFEGACIAKETVAEYNKKNPKKPKFVAGSIGPTNRTASMSPDVNKPEYRAVTFDMLKQAYEEQINGLIDGGVDLLLIETVFDTLNCKAAIYAATQCFEKKNLKLPLMVSFTITDASGRTLSGQTLEAFYISVSHADLFSIGINCALGAKQMFSYVKELSQIASCYISAYPNAGLPNAFGDYDESPKSMVENLIKYLEEGIINIVGGCCGTTPEHIKAISSIVNNFQPRLIPKVNNYPKFAGLEPLIIYPNSNFITIGERTNVAGSLKFANLIKANKYEEAVYIAREQINNGASIIDINMDDGMINSKETMVHFLNLIASEPEIAKVPFMIDSSNWEVIESALKCIQGKAIVNSISLKDGEDIFIAKAKKIKYYGAAMVVMAFDEQGQATTYERKIEIIQRSYKILTEKVGIKPENIIFDPNILTIATGMEEHANYANDYLKAVKWIKSNFKECLVSGGVSNLSFALKGNNTVREAMNSIFLYHAIKAGMDMGIVNAGMIKVYDDIPDNLRNLIEDVIFNKHKNATDKLIEYTHTLKNDTEKYKKEEETWRHKNIDEKLAYALIHGITEYIENDIHEALTKYETALKVIEIPLMNGMKEVGTLFGEGKMFLPQVVKSARVMKKAVDILLPYIEMGKDIDSKGKNGKILMATVKGDVHDIGKNIASVVLSCNNYEIIDLGVMVPCDKIIQTAIEEKVDAIGLSGLITPSLDEMIYIAKEMERHHLKIPLIIGGATTSKIHTAVKIQPEYSSLVIHVKDASQSVNIINQIIHNYDNFSKEHKKNYQNIKEAYSTNQNKKTYISLKEARKNKWNINWNKTEIVKPDFLGNKVFIDYSLTEICKYIDWTQFFKTWELKGHFPNILNDKHYGTEAKKLYADAKDMLENIINNNLLSARAVIGFYSANTINDDDIKLNNSEGSIIHFLRQQLKKTNNIPNFCLADFIAPIESGKEDYIGFFAVSVGFGTRELEAKYKKINDDYNALMVRILSDRLTEAFIELIHEKVRKEYWGYAKEENLSIENMLDEKYIGIRPAPGYPACPDHTEKQLLFDLLEVEKNIGIKLTENYFMIPESSTCGYFFANPKAKYLSVGKILEDQIEDYANRKKLNISEMKQLLAKNLLI